ncbi:MAG: glycosyltransferase family 2 protein [Anaerolineae bacterium]|nr:glycosyltransferase family 2 protein [Anaerolineae bacterium]
MMRELAGSVEFTLLMPCLNEAETLERCIQKAQHGLAAAGIEGEVLIADNGSSDGSPVIAEQAGARVVHVPQRGYGAALNAGIHEAKGRYVIMGDADDSYDWSQIAPFVEKLRAGYALVMGTRLKGKIFPGAMPALHRWLGNPVLTAIGNLLFGTRISDYHCGMRGFERSAVLDFNLQTSGMEFATELVAKASLHRVSMTEVPISYHPDGRTRRPHLRTWRDGWRHLIFMLLLSPTWVFFAPGLLLMIFGVIGNLLLLPGPLVIGGVTFDVHTLLVANMSLIIGVQVVLLGIVGHTFSTSTGILPRTRASRWFGRSELLSIGLALGVLLIFLSLLPVLHSVELWAQTDFGPIDVQVVLRWLIPGLALGALGMEIFFGSFMLGLVNFYNLWHVN